MRRKLQLEDWFENTQDQFDWARKYLPKKGIVLSTDQMTYSEWIRNLRGLGHHLGGDDLLWQMRNAWYQHQRNRHSKLKTYSFTLPKGIEHKLRSLAKKGQSNSHVIKELILRGFDFETEERAARRKASDEARKNQGMQRPFPGSTTRGEIKAKAEVRELRAQISALTKEFELILFESCECIAKLEALDGVNHRLSPEQQQTTQKSYEVRLAYFRNLISKQVKEQTKGPAAALPS